MQDAASAIAFTLALVLYGVASALFFGGILREKADAEARSRATKLAPTLLAIAALVHAAYVLKASVVAHVCPIRSVHFFLSVASLVATSTYLALRRRFRIEALGVLVGPLGLALLLCTYFLGAPSAEPHLSPAFISLHVVANLLGVALFWLAGGAAGLYLLQEKRLKEKRLGKSSLPPLDALDRAVHRFLLIGFPLLTLGILTGTFWAKQLETGTPEEVMRIVFSFVMWALIAGVLVMRVTMGWRGRRAAYGTIACIVCSAAVLAIYLVRPASTLGG